jgi:hypothetical protein
LFAILNFLGFLAAVATFGGTAFLKWGLPLKEAQDMFNELGSDLFDFNLIFDLIEDYTTWVLVVAAFAIIFTFIGFIAMCSGNKFMLILNVTLSGLAFLAELIWFIWQVIDSSSVVDSSVSYTGLYIGVSVSLLVQLLFIAGISYLIWCVSTYRRNEREDELELAMYRSNKVHPNNEFPEPELRTVSAQSSTASLPRNNSTWVSSK